MKIKNESILIKNGKKEYNFTNMILNTYLKQMINAIKGDNIFDDHAPDLEKCYIRFNRNDSFSFDENSILNIADFDLVIERTEYKIEDSNKSITLNMQYSLYDKVNDYIGAKLGFIGFADKNGVFYACVDVTNAGIYIQSNEELTIFRKDILSTEADLKSSTKKQGIYSPIHLINSIGGGLLTHGSDEYPNLERKMFAKLKNYGFGYSKFEMLNNFDIKTATFQDTSLTIDIVNNLYEGLYPSDDLYPSNECFPQIANFNYITFKFVVYQLAYKLVNNNPVYTALDTGHYYLLSMPLKYGQFQYKLKYEK